MDHQEFKMIMRSKAKMANGLVNLLRDDTEQMCVDADDFEIFRLGETIREAKRTAQHIVDIVSDLERDLRLAKRDA